MKENLTYEMVNVGNEMSKHRGENAQSMFRAGGPAQQGWSRVFRQGSVRTPCYNWSAESLEFWTTGAGDFLQMIFS